MWSEGVDCEEGLVWSEGVDCVRREVCEGKELIV